MRVQTKKVFLGAISLFALFVLSFICFQGSVSAAEESKDGVRNESLQMKIIPRGNPATSREREQRGKEHTSFESTGLFLYKGDEITIEVEGDPENLELRVGQWGGYTNTPYIATGSQLYAFQDGVVKLHGGTNKFTRNFSGGMVYLVNYSTTKTENITIKGGVKVPHYIQGKTSIDSFKNQLENYKDIPFMEFVNDDAIATIRIYRAKDIFEKGDQVDVFMSSLAKIVKLQNEAAGLSYDGQGVERKDPQRIHVVNPEWGAGQLFATNNFIGIHSATDKDRTIFSTGLSSTDWGMLHESGHTYQNKMYQWYNMTEVTVNIYADYVQKMWSSNGTGRYDAVNVKNGSRASVQKYFKKLEADPTWNFDREATETNDYHFALLGMFLTLPRTFGYDFYPVLNQSYRSLPEEELPKTDEEQKQLFILMTSKTAHRDLTPFFEHWRFTVTDETKEKLNALKLPTLEKEIWKDILATEQEEKAGTYRISNTVGPYSVPQVEWNSSIPQFPFENLRNALNASDLVANMYSTPIASNTSLVTTGTVADGTSFDIQNAYAYFINDLGIPNKIPFSVKITPGDSVVMRGQRGRYAVLSYDPKAKTLLARGNSNKILENLPNNLYPRVKVYDKNMQTVKKEAEGYGKTYGYEFAGNLDNVPVDVGDIVEIYHREATKRVQRYKNNELLTTNKDTYYYQITKTGWREITFNPQSIEGSSIAAKVGDSGDLDLQMTPSNSILPSSYEYTVSDPSVIKIDSKGHWQALKKGKTTINVTAKLPDVGKLAGADYPTELKTTIEVDIANSGAPIKIQYVDLQGNPLKDVPEQVLNGDTGDVIHLDQYALTVPGYTLLTETANKTAVISSEAQVISLRYGGNIIDVTSDNIGTAVGETGKLQIELVPEITEMPAEKLMKAKDITYQVADPSILQLASDGRWKALKNGSTTITILVTLDSGKKLKLAKPLEVTIGYNAKPIHIKYQTTTGKLLDEENIYGNKGENYQAIPKRINGYTAVPVKNQMFTFTDKSQEIVFEYEPNQLKLQDISVKVGDEGTFQVSILPETNKEKYVFEYVVENPDIVSVTSEGKWVAKKAGETTIEVRAISDSLTRKTAIAPMLSTKITFKVAEELSKEDNVTPPEGKEATSDDKEAIQNNKVSKKEPIVIEKPTNKKDSRIIEDPKQSTVKGKKLPHTGDTDQKNIVILSLGILLLCLQGLYIWTRRKVDRYRMK